MQHIDQLMSSHAFRCFVIGLCVSAADTPYRMLPGEVRRVVSEQVTKRDLVPVVRAAPGVSAHRALL